MSLIPSEPTHNFFFTYVSCKSFKTKQASYFLSAWLPKRVLRLVLVCYILKNIQKQNVKMTKCQNHVKRISNIDSLIKYLKFLFAV